MAAQNLPGTVAGNLTLGFLHIRANVTVRGRRGVPLTSNLSIRAVSYLTHPRTTKHQNDADPTEV